MGPGMGTSLIPMGSWILCYPFTLLDRDRELREWVSNPFWNLHGDLTGELMVSCTVNLYVHKFQFLLQCERIGIILIKFPFLVPVPVPFKLCLNRPLRSCQGFFMVCTNSLVSLPL